MVKGLALTAGCLVVLAMLMAPGERSSVGDDQSRSTRSSRRGDVFAGHRGTVCDSIGPDVIVGDLPAVANYSSGLNDAGVLVDAVSVATTSCNIGDEELLWEPDINQHPVIGQHMYRYKDGRFAQIGQSWLKHGFFALAQNACGCGCENPNDGTRLGVGCSDPYGAGLNGEQDGLGPKFEVNAFTGAFPYPPTDLELTGNSVYKRLQVKVDDLNPALNQGAQFFVEGHYVTPDDSLAGNQDNNASWRQVTVVGANDNYTVSVVVSEDTTREQPAIYAWQAIDPNVVLTEVRVPDEGLVIVGARAVATAPGVWRYEYAVHNLNSDRSIGSFTVPVDPAATISNIGFHDVDYHSGEPFSGDDWEGAFSAGEGTVSWSTESFASNPNANAIRWGTLYNFWFDANRPPQTANDAEFGLFKPAAGRGAANEQFASISALEVPPADCNENGVDDMDDITLGTSNDCNLNFVPDECEALPEPPIKATLIAAGLSQPVGAYAPPNDPTRLFILEQASGQIKIIDLTTNTVLPQPFLNLGAGGLGLVTNGGERGLLGLAFHPDYENNGKFYVNFTDAGGDTEVSQFTVSGDPNIANNDSRTILRTIAQDFSNHNGGCIQFGPDGKLYVGMGDGGSANDPNDRAQSDGSLLGKMLRLDVDNPGGNYVAAGNPGGAFLPDVWAKGLRNPWRFSFDRLSGDMYIADVGQDAWEEINFQPADSDGGENYGWRCYEGNVLNGDVDTSECPDAGTLVAPIVINPHGVDGTGSITGGYVYRGCAMPGLSGTYFYADFLGDYIRSFRLVDGVVVNHIDRTQEIEQSGVGLNAISSFGEDADGELYIVSIDGNVYRIEDGTPPPSGCGNGIVEAGEECDPPNSIYCDCDCQVVEEAVLLLDDFEDDLGWTTEVLGASSGQWERGVPVNDDNWDWDPVVDADGSGSAFLTQNSNGNTDVDNGSVRLLSPIVDLSAGSILVEYSYFLRLSSSDGVDALTVEYSGNGAAGPWFEIARHTTDGGLLWRRNSVTQEDIELAGGAMSSNAMFRFTANDDNPQTIVEAGVDAFGVFSGANYTDCNNNCVDDADDIANLDSFDCNDNGIPDECESLELRAFTSAQFGGRSIPDASRDGLRDNIDVTDTGLIADIDIRLDITHTHIGDLTVSLTHNDVTAVLLHRPGRGPGSRFGLDVEDVRITIDDEGAARADPLLASGRRNRYVDRVIPLESLRVFDGMNMAGRWTLQVSDSASDDQGTLRSWALDVRSRGGVSPCDCNGNGIDDEIDIANETSEDCNTNSVPDECDIAKGDSFDFAGGPVGNIASGENIILSNCSGCHGEDGAGGEGLPGPSLRNRTRDFIWNRLLPPTDHPGGARPDFTQQNFADLEAFLDNDGASGARPDMIPDECQEGLLPDCDTDGIPDAEELMLGTQVDADYDGLPDDCTPLCAGDVTADGLVNVSDLLEVINNWGTAGPAGDANADNLVNVADLLAVINNWGGC